MGRYLPSMVSTSRIRHVTQTAFAGLDMNLSAGDGAIAEMKNMSGDSYPVLAPRRPRRLIKKLSRPHGIYAHEGLLWVDGSELWRMTEAVQSYSVLEGTAVCGVTGADVKGKLGEAHTELVRIFSRLGELEDLCLTVSSGEKTLRRTSCSLEYDRDTYRVSVTDSSLLMDVYPNRCTLHAAQLGFEVGDELTVALQATFPRMGEVKVALVDASDKVFVSFGSKVIFFPDKKYLDVRTNKLGSLEASWAGEASIKDGTYAGSPAKLNSIVTSGQSFPFAVGDGVELRVSGDYVGTFIIREISADAKTLRFYENTFASARTDAPMTLSRSVPRLDYVCEVGNRLWGCAGDTIWCSKLGDATNWNVFDGISTDAWSITVQSAGDFTGCISYLGMPIFFKEQMIYKVYGDEPSEYQLIDSATLGIDAGSGASAVIAGETVFYISRGSVVGYSGGVPSRASSALGDTVLSDGVAGSDGVRYYLSTRCAGGESSLFVLNTDNGMWHREDSSDAFGFASETGALYMLCRTGELYALRYGEDVPKEWDTEVVESECSFAPYTSAGETERKGIGRVSVRCELLDRREGRLELYIRYGGRDPASVGHADVWEKLGELSPLGQSSYGISFVPRRCDSFRLRFKGRGAWRVYAISREYYHSNDYR